MRHGSIFGVQFPANVSLELEDFGTERSASIFMMPGGKRVLRGAGVDFKKELFWEIN